MNDDLAAIALNSILQEAGVALILLTLFSGYEKRPECLLSRPLDFVLVSV